MAFPGKLIWGGLLPLLLAAAALLAAGCNVFDPPGGSGRAGDSSARAAEYFEELPPEFAKLAEIWALLEREHIDAADLDPETAAAAAIRGMLDSLDDPHASYLDTRQHSMMRQDIQGYFEGIGAEVSIQNGLVTIVAPIPDTPAAEAGIRPRDVILAIDGESTAGLELFEVVNRIRGQQGTTVRLLVRRDRTGETEELEIVRGVIPLESVRLTMLVGRIGHLRITSFSGTSNEELEQAMERFRRSQGRGLVVDIRNNPGGLVSSVVDVTGQFIDQGLVLYQLDGQGNRRDWEDESGGAALDVPMVVLMNQGSASASEVFAGALTHHGRAQTIGVTTYGKGSVNNLWPLSDGSAVNFTVARWYTPSGIQIEGEGITPDIIQEASEDAAEDLQLDLAIEKLAELLAN